MVASSSLVTQAQDSSAPLAQSSQPRLGFQRNWRWRGWRVRYSFRRAAKPQGKPPVILVHGFGAALGHWRNNIEALSQGQDVYALDLLGFGNSEKAAAPYSPLFWADQLHDFWQSFVGRPAVLVGNSLGSVTCMMAAARYPQISLGLVWINLPDSSVLGPELPAIAQRTQRGIFALMRPGVRLVRYGLTSPLVINPLLTAIRPRRILTYWAKKAYYNPAVVDDELMDVLGLPPYDRGARQALRAMTRFVANVPNAYRARQALPKLTVPMLLLWGKQDTFVPPMIGPKVAALNPRIRLVELDQAGHCPQDECPEVVNGLLLEWLGQLAASDGQA
ncbi:MAG: alpha/beta fold hydrolase [Synechococcales cyanobacterium RM1_1_8]|nr:alpha/beta fold hydrolase [Synechococcales cyanobacterium RM1_1_8]